MTLHTLQVTCRNRFMNTAVGSLTGENRPGAWMAISKEQKGSPHWNDRWPALNRSWGHHSPGILFFNYFTYPHPLFLLVRFLLAIVTCYDCPRKGMWLFGRTMQVSREYSLFSLDQLRHCARTVCGRNTHFHILCLSLPLWNTFKRYKTGLHKHVQTLQNWPTQTRSFVFGVGFLFLFNCFVLLLDKVFVFNGLRFN